MKFDSLIKQENIQYFVSIWAIDFKQFGPIEMCNLELKLYYYIIFFKDIEKTETRIKQKIANSAL